MENFTDSELLKNIKGNNHFAFDILFERYWKKLHQTASARLDDDDIAQDIVQELFIKIWNRRASLNVKTSLENYLHHAVRLSVISHYRSKKATETQLQKALEHINWLEDSIPPVSDYIELEKIVHDAAARMPEMLKKVYQLRSENHSVKDIAVKLGLADQTVKNYIAEVTRRLRVAIAKKHPEKHSTYGAPISILHK